MKTGIESIFNIKDIVESARVCLIIPPSAFLLDDRVFISLGILKIAAVLKKSNIHVEVLDLSGVKNFLDVVSDYTRIRNDITCFALTSTTPQLPAVTKIIETIRSIKSDVKVILGGPHITLVNAAYKNEVANGVDGRAVKAMSQAREMFDVLICGDGEKSIFIALSENSPKLVDADDRHSPLFLTNEDLNESPFPARYLVDVESYEYTIDGVSALSLIAQLGCPFVCGFCGGRKSPMLRHIRRRSSESVVAEMVHLYKTYGRRGFMFYDDELNVNKNLVELMNLISQTQKDLGVEWRLRGFVKSHLFTDEQASAMYNAGFRWILVGFESGSPEILKAINKKATRKENTRCMEIAKRHGLKVKALMSIGHPGETKETVFSTKEWLLETRPDDFDVTIITSYPGTAYYDQAVLVQDANHQGVWVYTCKKTGSRLYQIEVDYSRDADYYKGNPDDGYKSYVFTDHLSPEDLVELRDGVEREVRLQLGIPFNQGVASKLYDHSMGQQGVFHRSILRTS